MIGRATSSHQIGPKKHLQPQSSGVAHLIGAKLISLTSLIGFPINMKKITIYFNHARVIGLGSRLRL